MPYQDVVELIERCLMSVLDPSVLSHVGSFATTAPIVSTQQNVVRAENINTPNSSTFANSTSG